MTSLDGRPALDDPEPGSSSRRVSAPYVGLAPFEADQAALFFGRERATRLIASNLLAFRLTVLIGPSGVGKSSILAAGVVPEVRRRARTGLRPTTPLVVYVNSWRDDPAVTIAAAVRNAASEIGLELPPALDPGTPLRERLERWAADVGHELYLVCDQFEDFFLYHGASARATADIADALGADLPLAHVLLAVREDAFAKLDRFQSEVPSILENTFRLHHLNRAEAAAAIVEPLGVLNAQDGAAPAWTMQDGLVDRVLDEIRVGDVVIASTRQGQLSAPGEPDGYETAHLQLVLDRLWAAEQDDDAHVLKITTLDALGGAQGIVRSHLSETLAGLDRRERRLAAEMFVHLVTPSGTKIALGVDDLAEYAAVPVGDATTVLEELAAGDRRIVRPVPPALDRPDVPRFEIFHDALGPAISEWCQQEAENQRIHRERRRWLVVSAVAVVLGALLLATIGLYRQAQDQKARATSEREATAALDELHRDPVDAATTALSAWSSQHSDAAETSLRRVAANLFLERVLVGHRGAITSGELSPDGELFLTSSEDGTATLWPLDGGEPRELDGGDGKLALARFTPDGGRVVTVSAGRVVRVWDAGSGAELRSTVPTTDALPFDLRIDPTGTSAAVLSEAPGVEVIALDTGAAHWVLADQDAYAVGFTLGGDLAVSVAAGIEVVDPATGAVLASAPDQYASAMGTNPVTGDLAFGNSAGSVYTWQWDEPGYEPEYLGSSNAPMQAVTAIAFSPDGTRLLASVEKVGVLYSLDDRLARPTVMPAGFDWTGAVAFSVDGARAVIGTADGVAVVVDGTTGAPIAPLRGHRGAVVGVAAAPDGRIVTASRDGTVRIWRPPAQETYDAGAWAVAVAADRAHDLLVAGGDGHLRMWRLGDRRPIVDLETDAVPAPGLGFVQAAAISPDGQRVAVGGNTNTVWMLGADGELHQRYDAPDVITSLAFVDGGHALAVGLSDGEVLLWRWREPDASIPVLTQHDGAALLAATPDGTVLATTSTDGTVRVFDMRTRDLVQTTGTQATDIKSIAISADGARIATGGSDRAVRVWDAATGDETLELRGHDAPVTAVAFDDDGTRIASGAADGTVGFWDAATGQALFLAAVHGTFTNSVAFLDDGRLVSGGDDRLVRVQACTTCGPIEDIVADLHERTSAIPTTPAFRAVDSVSTLDIVAGMCRAPLSRDDSVRQVSPVPCDEPHDTEVYAVFRLPDPPEADMPADLFARGDRICRDEFFESYVGIPAAASVFTTKVLAPDDSAWAGGQRKIICELVPPAGVTGSARGARR